jgi:hypothetical protein
MTIAFTTISGMDLLEGVNPHLKKDNREKPQERQPREENLFIFLTLILNLGRVLNVNIHKLG